MRNENHGAYGWPDSTFACYFYQRLDLGLRLIGTLSWRYFQRLEQEQPNYFCKNHN